MSGIEIPVLPVEQEEEVTVAPERKGFFGRLHKIPFVASISKHIPADKFGRYLLVGAWNTFFSLAAFVCLNTALTNVVPYSYIVASILAPLISWTVAYLGYKIFVFKTKGNYIREWIRCAMVYGSSLILNVVLMPILVTTIRYAVHIAVPTAIGVDLHSHYWTQRLITVPNFAYTLLTGGNALYSFLALSKFSFRPAQ